MFTFRRSIFVSALAFFSILTSSVCLRLVRSAAEESSTSVVEHVTTLGSSDVKCGIKRDIKSDALSAGTPPDEYSKFAEYPWTVAILQKSDAPTEDGTHTLGYICSGSLVSATVVLTAAHCVFNVDRTTLQIRAGIYDMNSDPFENLPHQERTVKQISIHGNYSKKTLGNDIALLKVSEAFNFEQHVSPICLPSEQLIRTSSSDWYDQHNCVVSGWGKNSRDDKSAFPQKLKKVSVDILAEDQCESRLRTTRLGTTFKLHPSFVCALEKNPSNNVCEGYGGAPLVCSLKSDPESYVQTGITSWGIGCSSYIPGAYASLLFNFEWLDKELKSMNGS